MVKLNFMNQYNSVYILSLAVLLLFFTLQLSSCGTSEEQMRAPTGRPDTTSITIMGTTDLHGYVRAWDYYRDEGGLDYGMSRVATLVDSVRRQNPNALFLDAGDWLQGNSFAEYFARVDQDQSHYGLLQAADYMEYDAFVLGNHEFDYGLEYLNRQIDQTQTPVLGANMYYHESDEPAYKPYVIREVNGLKVGILGLNTPGTAVWNRSRVKGEIDYHDGTEVAHRFVPKIREEGADVVVVLAHSAFDGDDSYTEEGVPEENFGRSIVENVPGVDALVLGHRHRTFETIEQGAEGGLVPVIEAGRWGSHLGIIELDVVEPGGNMSPMVIRADTRMHSTAHAREHLEIVDLVEDKHEAVREYVNQPVASTPDEWSAENARKQPTPAIELINQVQLSETGAQLSAAAAFNTNVNFGPGEIRLGDIAMLYPYENSLYKMELTGRQIRSFLEYTSQYYLQPEFEGRLNTNEDWPGFNYDMLAGVEYELDLNQEPGDRVVKLEYDGEPVDDNDTFTVAINSYRAEGGGGFEMLADAEVLEVIDTSVRDLIINYLNEKDEITTSDYETANWRLIY